MKKITLIALLVSGMASGAAMADNQTVSVGYAQSKVEGFKNVRGVNLQYRYEFNSPFSVLTSFTYMKGSDSADGYIDEYDYLKVNEDVKYYSLLAGPAYRINDYISLYAMGGIAHTKADVSVTLEDRYDGYAEKATASASSNSFAYGAGVIINPIENLSVTVGYEGTRADLYGNRSVNGFNVGVGYRF